MIISIDLELDRHFRELKSKIKEVLLNIFEDEVHTVRVNMAQDISQASRGGQSKDETPGRARGLSKVKHIIAVASCKGGVGKSTVAVNLAYTLSSKKNLRVGIYDADIFGPSLPTMISPSDTVIRQDERNMLFPLTYEGVKAMSFGFVKTGAAGSDPHTGLAIMRGPMVSNVVSQLLTFTDWGELDYLIIDMPPGTGDIHLTLSQAVTLSA